MAEKKFTLFEVHLGDGHTQFGPSSIGAGGWRGSSKEDEGASEFSGDDAEDSSGGLGLIPLVIALVVLVALVFVAKKFVGGGGMGDIENLDELGE